MENRNPSRQILKKKRKLVELLECKDYIVPLNPDVIIKNVFGYFDIRFDFSYIRSKTGVFNP
ncbi:hypothetical protein EFP47_17720 [Lactiplantibacillus pentosus]|nr:hypothetical protein [Lactiplantibacillus pentosus]